MKIDDPLCGYLAAQFADADLLGQTDEQAAADYVSRETRAAYQEVLDQGRAVLTAPSLDWRRIGDYANRYFKNEDEARRWLTRMMDVLEAALRKV